MIPHRFPVSLVLVLACAPALAGPEEEPPLEVEVLVRVRREGDGHVPYLEGRCGLPDEAILSVVLRSGADGMDAGWDPSTVRRTRRVVGGACEADLGSVMPGPYEMEISLDPRRQYAAVASGIPFEAARRKVLSVVVGDPRSFLEHVGNEIGRIAPMLERMEGRMRELADRIGPNAAVLRREGEERGEPEACAEWGGWRDAARADLLEIKGTTNPLLVAPTRFPETIQRLNRNSLEPVA